MRAQQSLTLVAPTATAAQLPDVELVYRDVVAMLRAFVKQFAKLEQFCWRWSYTPEPPTARGEAVVEHPASAAWWREQAAIIEGMGGSLLALQLYSDDTTLNKKRSRSAYPMYVVPLNGTFDLYTLLFPTSVVAYMPVLSCPLAGAPLPPTPRTPARRAAAALRPPCRAQE